MHFACEPARGAAEIEVVDRQREREDSVPCRQFDELGGKRALAAALQPGQTDQPRPWRCVRQRVEHRLCDGVG
jgi:hypothetical protein